MLQFYEILYEILFLLSFLAFILGMFDPCSVIKWGRKKNRKHVFLVYGVATIVFLILISVVVSIRNSQGSMIMLNV